MCIAGECISINEKHKSVEDCKLNGSYLKFMLDEQNIRKYFFACVDATEYEQS
jgi:hypothetical protein